MIARSIPPLARQLADAGLDWIVPAWPAPACVSALVTTRNGGASTGACATLNLGAHAADSPAAVAENRRRLDAFLPSPPRWLRQVHGTTVAVHTDRDGEAPVADAAVTATPGVVCAVMTADCLPVLLADCEGAAVGIAHAGWRGLSAGVLERTVDALADLGVPAERVTAWLGPAIGQAAFEVGEDVRAAFANADPRAIDHFHAGAPGKWHADLYGLARQRLAGAGVRSIGGGGFCTRSDVLRFFSWRRDRDGGRMASLVWLAPREQRRNV